VFACFAYFLNELIQLKALAQLQHARRKNEKERNRHTPATGSTDPIRLVYINLTFGFIPRKHVNTMQAGLLACNIFAVLPISPETVDFFTAPASPPGDSGHCEAKTLALLTVAGQLVIYTQFPINPDASRGPSTFDEEIKKELFPV
jgi:hypothetical protein